MSVNEACTLAGICRRTFYNWLNAGRLDYVRTSGGSIRIYVDSLFRRPDGSRYHPKREGLSSNGPDLL